MHYIGLSAGTLDFSVERGYHYTPFSLAISTDLPGATIRYTTDVSLPTATYGNIYSSAIPINTTSIVRAIAYNSTDTLASETHTYLFMQDVIADPIMKTHITQDPTWGPQVENSLLSLPAVLVTTGDPLLNNDTKIVGSAEFMFPDTGEKFGLNCGVKLFGNGGSHTTRLSIRLYFDKEWDGPKNLKYPLFDDFAEGFDPVDKFDKLDLRHGWYTTYSNQLHDIRYPDYKRHHYISTKMGDDMLLKLGSFSPHTRFAHVFRNGVYDGIVTLRERWDDNLHAEYFGGEPSDYEYLATPNHRVSVFHPFAPDLQSGTGVHWANAVNSSMTSYTAFQDIVDIDAFYDRMIIFIYAQGEAEYRAVAAPQLGEKFKINFNDADYIFHAGSATYSNRTNPSHNMNGPENMFRNLYELNDADMRMDFADRVHKHMTGDGFLTPNNVYDHWQYVASIVEDGILAEAARWSNDAQENPDTWRVAIDTVSTIYTDIRTDIVLEDLKDVRLYPTLDEALYAPSPGLVPANSTVSLTNPNSNGTIYYTTNGDDPRASGGAVDASAMVYAGPILINNGVTEIRSRILGTDTTYPEINHAVGMPSSISSNLSATLYQAANANDGDIFGVLNGDYVTRPTNEDEPWWEVNLTAQKPIHKVKVWYSSDLGTYYLNREFRVFVSPDPIPDVDVNTLLTLPNITSFYHPGEGGDVLEFELPAGYTGQYVRVVRDEYTQTLWLAEVEVIEVDYANPQVNQVWSAMKPYTYYTAQNYGDLVINEIHYNPADSIYPTDTIDGDSFEFIEIVNTGSSVVHLTDVEFSDGIYYTFPYGESIAPGDYLVLAEDSVYFNDAYGFMPDGQYKGKLKNSSELIVLDDPFDALIDSVHYSDDLPWDTIPDNGIYSLALIEQNLNNDLPASWGAQLVPVTPKAKNVFCVPISYNLNVQQLSCAGVNDASIIINATGGQGAPYSYIWSHGPIGNSLTSLSQGTYSCTVYDQYNCPEVVNVTISPAPTTPVINLNFVTITGTSMILNWNWVTGNSLYYLQYREVGQATWSTYSTTGTTAILNGLTACSDYEFRIGGDCAAGGTNGFNPIVAESTVGCFVCTAPLGLYQFNIQNISAIITWDVLVGATNYTYKFRKVGDPNWISQTTTFPIAVLFGISGCTDYEWTMETTCYDGSTAQSATINNFTTVCKNDADDIAQELNLTELDVFPNPSSRHINVKIPNSKFDEEHKLEILSMDGKIIESHLIQGGILRDMNIAHLPNGTYIIRAISNDSKVYFDYLIKL